MIRAFSLQNDRLINVDETAQEQLNDAIWIDLIDPSDEERSVLEHRLDQTLAEEHELEDLEASARFFEDEDGLHMHSFFYCLDDEDYPDIATVGFTIRDGRLFTIRERDLPAFRLYRMRSRRAKLIDGNAYELLLDLFETKIEQLADVIENIYADLEKLSRVILNEPDENEQNKNNNRLNDALSDLTELEDASSKVRQCLMDTQRALGFLLRKTRLPNNQLEQARDIMRDVESLQPHNESLFQKVNFLMQAAMGFINIEQNRIMKVFSLVSVMFLPATLISSIYGMNFEFMPELGFKFGYPMALGLMLLVATSPYIYFKRKGWL
ncbi:transport protein [Bibersteinia trehalosi USDA-ARS-USMARC-188]|uniref:Magnesium transport protein CorA n=5 Tax=Bibersteinia trehalosi TaxID=47735 RepID=W0RAE9_BIBTR|nr:magnesium/cobalt transporter CorA [Bibersteinia trehalosi]AGH39348.1 transport protein [Bibersteinia trehalosi USDA-ARS-USMARC-192]AHG80905.1 transport protein [Bibersteinia trehalosi USDA-ARS-USMARC-188]AHG83118.1 transport protein [Bibersteinia trehalosi USDA-ARS-USMARC-189]AHG87280.1 transport protein [Bibersteinia trehalosi USDA-ARS-USMARC-190]OAQ14131.1 magnesium/nickel/cobalt transporter CorA [Bibersteinia trehalosi Y31]